MKRKLAIIIRNTLVFWVFIDLMPGINSYHGLSELFIASVSYGFLIYLLPGVLKFFKLPKGALIKILVGTVLTALLLALYAYVVIGILDFESSTLGGSEVLWINIPQLLVLNSIPLVIIIGSTIVTSCSIILAVLSKTDS